MNEHLKNMAMTYFWECEGEPYDKLLEEGLIIEGTKENGISESIIKDNLNIDELKQLIEIASEKYYHLWNDKAEYYDDLYFGYGTAEYGKYLAKKKELEGNKLDNKLITNVTQNLLNQGYKIKDFELYVEQYNGEIYLASFSNSKSGLDDYGVGDTEKYITSDSRILGFKVEYGRDGADIAENGKLIDHQAIYREFTTNAQKRANLVVDQPTTALKIEVSYNKVNYYALAPSLKLLKQLPSLPKSTKFQIVDWQYDITKGGGYLEMYNKTWKKALINDQEQERDR